MRKLVLGIFILITTNNLFSQNLSELSFGTDNTFEVISWNIEWFPKNGQTTVDSVSVILESLDADVYAIQEVDDTTIFKQMVDYLDGYEYFFKSSYFAGLAYVYKSETIEITDIYEIYTSQPYWSPFPRSPVVMELTFNNEEIIIINNHFKCCGNGIMNLSDSGDEETRRYYASNLLKEYIDNNFSDKRVIMLGDLNDIITDSEANNVFQGFLNDSLNYQFSDMEIALGQYFGWSYPSWPSHLDHILITNEVFDEFVNPESEIKVIKVDEFISGGWSAYDNNVSDHRPVGLKLKLEPTLIEEIKEETFTIYPNPARSIITLEFKPSNSINHLQIYSSLGKITKELIIESNSNSVSINVSNFKCGIYFIGISNSEINTQYKRLIITD